VRIENISQLKQQIKTGLKAVTSYLPDWPSSLQQIRRGQEQPKPERTRQDVEPSHEG
jgi:hypothetical protein